jgi:2-C-methyl-D-erythritol 4-phosphate cytidylyltransferase/2-C-methyl-D-erythritol 2,4-cyclodiphosphate synthase
MIEEIIQARNSADIIVPYLDVSDTVVYSGATIDRDAVKLIQTPQLSKTSVLQKALMQKTTFTDDSSAIKAMGGKVFYVKGSNKAKKITVFDDLGSLACLKGASDALLVGTGFDVHQFCKDKKMVLAGVEIETELGFLAHSDGDVALHALIDALLGAMGAGDIGERFPDTDIAHKGADSRVMLQEVVDFISSVGFVINNVDITIIAQTPKISSYKMRMREVIAGILKLAPVKVNIKATTTEKLGFIGRKEGVGVEAIASLKYRKWEVK